MLVDTLKYGTNLSKVCGAEKGGFIVYHVLIKGLLFCSARIRGEAAKHQQSLEVWVFSASFICLRLRIHSTLNPKPQTLNPKNPKPKP